MSKSIHDFVNQKTEFLFNDIGEQRVKNTDVHAFDLALNNLEKREAKKEEKLGDVNDGGKPPAIAILPFKNLSNDEEQEYFCEGFSEDLLSMLSRYNKLVVISSHASFAYKEKSKSFKEIGKELGVRYVIHGSVRKLGPRMRINANLVSTENEKSIWSNNFDLKVEEVFDVQDKIAEEMVSTIVGRVEADALCLLYTSDAADE